MIDFDGLKAIILQLAPSVQAAGAEIMGIRSSARFSVTRKNDDSPVTEADYASNTIVCAAIGKLDFQAPIISEELPLQPLAERKDWEYFWLIDPLDGTKDFVSGRDEFAVNVALVHRNRPILGIIALPALGELYAAALGGPLMKYEGGCLSPAILSPRPGLALHMHSHSGVEDSECALAEKLAGSFGPPAHQPGGASFKHVMIALGSADLYVKYTNTCEWDTAAGQILLECAGGACLRIADGQPMQYNGATIYNEPFAMVSARLLEQSKRILSK